LNEIRVGVDVVDIARLGRALERYPRLADRLFTPREKLYARERARPVEHLAARVAAKEATFKALGYGWPRVSWLEVEVVSDRGRPSLVLTGRAAELARGETPSVSLSHDGGIAIAQVILPNGGIGSGESTDA
jgi:holo-[acyl-carrier protein] synthase